ncbi:MAG: aminoglycoside phosphotransferase family protein [Defluviitaleaceae bacterium]|nr:aminoglycoside phosphotransferase family protein [Defluviitaleaceae bacterium]
MKILESAHKVKQIHTGVSRDEKYHMREEFFLRIFDLEQMAQKEREFQFMKKLFKEGIPIAKPIKIGECDGKGYVKTAWIKGKTFSKVIEKLSEDEMYEVGLEMGQHLKNIHRVGLNKKKDSWVLRYNERYDRFLLRVEKKAVAFPKLGLVTEFFEKHKHLLEHRPQTFLHNDFGAHNFIMSEAGMKIIDFNNFTFGDPWYDFRYIVPKYDRRNENFTSYFSTGCVHGYFNLSCNENPPQAFWDLLALYTVIQRIESCTYVAKDEKIKQSRVDYLEYCMMIYDDLQQTIPKWYQNTMAKLQEK